MLLQPIFDGSKRSDVLCRTYYFSLLQSKADTKRHLITHFKVPVFKTLVTSCVYTVITT